MKQDLPCSITKLPLLSALEEGGDVLSTNPASEREHDNRS